LLENNCMKTIALIFLSTFFIQKPTIETDKARWKIYFTDAAVSKTAENLFLPFESSDRKSMKNISLVSIFGDHRNSYLNGHIHTAIDINPAKPATALIPVFAMANGVVCSIHLGEEQKTVVVKHQLKGGTIVFTSYKHLKEVYVTTGQQVNETTKLARLFTKEESKKYNGDFHHLHLEIRKKFDDYGCASWLTMTKEQLNERYYNPQIFIKEHVK
jgi:murein DD-endopeptidase MepM/ murein hydrolase activator NlpD